MAVEEIHNFFHKNEALFCAVCNSLAGKHNYYGARVCVSCRGFFRRSVQSRQYSLFTCVHQQVPHQVCLVDSKSRKSCKRCRFDRCLSSGMRIAWVLTDEERQQRIMRKQILKTPNFTLEEHQHAHELYRMCIDTISDQYYHIFANDIYHFRVLFNHFLEGRPFPYELIKLMEAVDGHAITTQIFKLLGHLGMNVSGRDVHALVQNNFPRVIGFFWCLYCEPCDMEMFLSDFMNYGFNHRNESSSIDLLVQEMTDMKLAEKKGNYNYELIFSSPWAPHVEVEKRHKTISQSVSRWLRHGEGQQIDRVQMALLSIILMCCTDGTVNMKAVEEIQNKYVTMLHRYLKDKYPQDANTRLANGLMIIHNAKEVFEIHSKRLPV